MTVLVPDLSRRSALDGLLALVNETLSRGDIRGALRFADRARRQARDSNELTLLCGRLLLSIGDGDGAFALLNEAPAHHKSAEFEAAVVEALIALGRHDEAALRLERALLRYAVDPEGTLAAAARRLGEQAGPAFPGWIAITPGLEICGELPAFARQRRLEIGFPSGTLLQEHRLEPEPEPMQRFIFPIADPGEHAQLLASIDGKTLLGGALRFPPAFGLDGRIGLTDGKIAGWVSFEWNPRQTINLIASGSDGARQRIATTTDPIQSGRQVFSLDDTAFDLANPIHFHAVLPNGRLSPLPGSPLRFRPAETPRSKRLARFMPARRALPRKRRGLDIIVPVYRGRDQTLACLHALLLSRDLDTGIIVIDDASPDLEIKDALDRFQEAGSITLIRNKRNMGFPGALNLGLDLHKDRDVIVLNSDTLVFPGWIERLRNAAYSAANIGTVTPLSNAGSIASYPRLEESDCSEAEAEAFDQLTATENADVRIDLPTGVGFCLYIRRDCLNAVGYLDAETFAQGYGEENDLCLRAAGAGWRNILAADVFVQHTGGISFGRKRAALLDRNLRLLRLRYPSYDAELRAYIAADPIGPLRRRLDEQRLVAAERPHVLLFTLALPGGVERHVRERCEALRAKGFAPLIVKPEGPGSSRHVLVSDDLKLENLRYGIDELPKLGALLSRLSIDHIELHHFLGLDARFVGAAIGGEWAYDIYVHDFSWYCPRLTLLNGDFRYCGEPALAACETCIETHGSELEETISVGALRERSAQWLRNAREIVVPSRDTAEHLRRQFPDIAPTVSRWEAPVERREPRSPPSGERVRVALIGAIGKSKGFDILLSCAEDAAERDLPLEFSVIGYTEDDERLMKTGRVFVTGTYEEHEIDGLIRREDPHLAFFPSVWPETWCYALTHALRAGLSVCAFDIGAVAERLRETDRCPYLFPLDLPAAALNDRLLEISREVAETASKALLPINPPSSIPTSTALVAAPPRVAPMNQTPSDISASVQVFSLSDGLYLFSVRSASPSRVGGDGRMILPAVNVAVCPGASPDQVEFLSGPAGNDKWLFSPNHLLVVKITNGPAMLLLTSVRTPGLAPLDIDVQLLGPSNAGADMRVSEALTNGHERANGTDAGIRHQPAFPPVPDDSLRLQVVAHVRNRGDLPFVDGTWAGCVGEGLWVESFSVVPLELLTPDGIEYKGLTATGLETPWISGGAPCGTRGKGVPLVGFAIRVKPGADGRRYDCQYSASFLSGANAGPMKNGAPCLSGTANDPLEAIHVTITALPNPAEMSATKISNGHSPALDDAAAGLRAPVGPRFSVFRETSEM